MALLVYVLVKCRNVGWRRGEVLLRIVTVE